MKDKPIAEIADILFPKATNLIITQPENPRAMSAAEIAAYAPEDNNTIFTETVDEALRTAAEVATKDGLTLITGSLYLIGEAKKILNNC
jgi:dihydrofolate synthase/folylpolyglutamate synthase